MAIIRMSVEWYRAEENTQALEAKLKECRAPPPNCGRKIRIARMRRTPQ